MAGDTGGDRSIELRSGKEEEEGEIFDPTDSGIQESFERSVPVAVSNPDYPRSALRRRIQGFVTLGGIIERDGTISHDKMIRPSAADAMNQAALTAFQ